MPYTDNPSDGAGECQDIVWSYRPTYILAKEDPCSMDDVIEFSNWLDGLITEDGSPEYNLWICVDGGTTEFAFAMAALLLSAPTYNLYILKAHSAGVLMLFPLNKSRINAFEHSSFMSHEVSIATQISSSQLNEQHPSIAEIATIKKICDEKGIPFLPQETYFSAEKAFDLGLIGRIMQGWAWRSD